MLNYIKCMECKKYNDNDLVNYTCDEYKKIPSEILNGNKICSKFEEEKKGNNEGVQ